jgi:hypothetical protein
MLEKGEIAWALENVRKLPAGKYTVRQIFGVHWEGNHRPRHFGKLFKASVLHGDLPGCSGWDESPTSRCCTRSAPGRGRFQ